MIFARSTSLKTAPSNEPITLSEAKSHLRVDTSDEDSLIEGLITASRQHVETYTRRALVTQTWEAVFDSFPGEWWAHEWAHYYTNDTTIQLPFPPLQAVNSVTYTDTNGSTQTFDSAKYQVDTKRTPGRIRPVEDEDWPSTQDEALNAVIIDFDAGYGAADDVPQAIKQAMYLLIGELYERREQAVVGPNINEIPLNAQMLLGPYRVLTP